MHKICLKYTLVFALALCVQTQNSYSQDPEDSNDHPKDRMTLNPYPSTEEMKKYNPFIPIPVHDHFADLPSHHFEVIQKDPKENDSFTGDSWLDLKETYFDGKPRFSEYKKLPSAYKKLPPTIYEDYGGHFKSEWTTLPGTNRKIRVNGGWIKTILPSSDQDQDVFFMGIEMDLGDDPLASPEKTALPEILPQPEPLPPSPFQIDGQPQPNTKKLSVAGNDYDDLKHFMEERQKQLDEKPDAPEPTPEPNPNPVQSKTAKSQESAPKFISQLNVWEKLDREITLLLAEIKTITETSEASAFAIYDAKKELHELERIQGDMDFVESLPVLDIELLNLLSEQENDLRPRQWIPETDGHFSVKNEIKNDLAHIIVVLMQFQIFLHDRDPDNIPLPTKGFKNLEETKITTSAEFIRYYCQCHLFGSKKIREIIRHPEFKPEKPKKPPENKKTEPGDLS